MGEMTIKNKRNIFKIDDDKIVGIEVNNGETSKYVGRIFKINSRETAIGVIGYEAGKTDEIKEFTIKCHDIQSFYQPTVVSQDEFILDYLSNLAKSRDALSTNIRMAKAEINWIDGMFTTVRSRFSQYDRGPGIESGPFQASKGSQLEDIGFTNGHDYFQIDAGEIVSINFNDAYWAVNEERTLVGTIYEAAEDSQLIRVVGYFIDMPDDLQVLDIDKTSVLSIEKKLLSQQLKQILNLYSGLLIAHKQETAYYDEAKKKLKEIKEIERKTKAIFKG